MAQISKASWRLISLPTLKIYMNDVCMTKKHHEQSQDRGQTEEKIC